MSYKSQFQSTQLNNIYSIPINEQYVILFTVLQLMHCNIGSHQAIKYCGLITCYQSRIKQSCLFKVVILFSSSFT